MFALPSGQLFALRERGLLFVKVAIYGKGGIGKSTIASNVSACCALQGKKILQIGCDPKHDSTILVSNGEYPTVLDMLRNNFSLTEKDVIHKGKYGISCIEIGGPTPGVGCAGRGIIRGIEIVEKLGILQNDYDLIIYDILGDVVCGGFFEPIKNQKADVMYVVTSGEFNSLFAANNLCAGYVNCGLKSKGLRFGGIIGNMRGIENEDKIITEFCKMVQVDLIALIPRDNSIENCTFTGVPVVEKYKDSKIGYIYQNIAQHFMCEPKTKNTPIPIKLTQLRELILAMK